VPVPCQKVSLALFRPSDILTHKRPSPITSTFNAARTLAQSPIFPSLCLTRAEYLERGTTACRRKFANVNWFAGEANESTLGRRESTGGRRETGTGRKERKGSLLGKEAGRRKTRGEGDAGDVGGTGEGSGGIAVVPKRRRKSTISKVDQQG
jgi:hypothetical protein